MLKMLTQFKCVIQNCESQFNFESNCPTNVAKEAIFECLKWIGQVEDQAKLLQQQQSEKPVEQPLEQPTEAINEQSTS